MPAVKQRTCCPYCPDTTAQDKKPELQNLTINHKQGSLRAPVPTDLTLPWDKRQWDKSENMRETENFPLSLCVSPALRLLSQTVGCSIWQTYQSWTPCPAGQRKCKHFGLEKGLADAMGMKAGQDRRLVLGETRLHQLLQAKDMGSHAVHL